MTNHQKTTLLSIMSTLDSMREPVAEIADSERLNATLLTNEFQALTAATLLEDIDCYILNAIQNIKAALHQK